MTAGVKRNVELECFSCRQHRALGKAAVGTGGGRLQSFRRVIAEDAFSSFFSSFDKPWASVYIYFSARQVPKYTPKSPLRRSKLTPSPEDTSDTRSTMSLLLSNRNSHDSIKLWMGLLLLIA